MPELLERRDGPVAYLTLNRPHAMNAFTRSLADALHDACLRLRDDARVLVIAGAGDHFSVGGDVNDLASSHRHGGGVRGVLSAFGALCRTIEHLPIPVIAAVRGYALAGGFELIQCCDIVLLGETARLSDHHTTMGVVPAGGGSQRLPRIVGRPRAMAQLLTGEYLGPAEALAWGLAYRVYPEDELDEAVGQLARRLGGRNLVALAATKSLVNEGLERPLNDGLEHERDVAATYLETGGLESLIASVSG